MLKQCVEKWKRCNTVKDPSHSVHRDYGLSFVLVQTRAHYNSHNRPDITSAVTRCPARRSSPETHLSFLSPSSRRRRFLFDRFPPFPFSYSLSDIYRSRPAFHPGRFCAAPTSPVIDCGTRLPGQPPRQPRVKTNAAPSPAPPTTPPRLSHPPRIIVRAPTPVPAKVSSAT